MSEPDLPHRTEPAAGESESVRAPHRDDKPPRRRGTPALWVGLIVLAAVAVAVLVAALGFGLLAD
jgi:hypothetical protein